MSTRHLTLESPVVLIFGLEAPVAESDYADRLLWGFQTISRMARAGATLYDLVASKIRADDNPGEFPPSIPGDTPVFSINWKATMSMAQAIQWALDEAGDDYAGALSDHLQTEGIGQIAECQIEGLYDELRTRLTGLLQEGHRPAEDP